MGHIDPATAQVADEEEADMLRITSIKRITSISVVALALAVPVTAGAQDLRAPDTRDVASGTAVGDDLRSPDARNGAAAVAPAAGQDMRSPDARDTTRPIAPSRAPDPVVVDTKPEGFGWGDAGIGAAGTLGILFALAGIGLLATHQRRRDAAPVSGH